MSSICHNVRPALSVLLLFSVGCSGLAPNATLYTSVRRTAVATSTTPTDAALADAQAIADVAIHQAQVHRNKFYFFSVAGFGIGLGGTLFSTLASAESTKKESAQIATAVGTVVTSLIGLYHWEKQAGTSQACGEKITIARNALKLADPADTKAVKDAIDAIYKIDDCSSTYVIQFAGPNQD